MMVQRLDQIRQTSMTPPPNLRVPLGSRSLHTFDRFGIHFLLCATSRGEVIFLFAVPLRVLHVEVFTHNVMTRDVELAAFDIKRVCLALALSERIIRGMMIFMRPEHLKDGRRI